MNPDRPARAHKENIVLGMLAGLGAFFMFTLMNACAKLLADRHSVIEIAFYRNLIAILPFLVLIFGLGRREISQCAPAVAHSIPKQEDIAPPAPVLTRSWRNTRQVPEGRNTPSAARA